MFAAYFMGSREIWITNNFKELWFLVREHERLARRLQKKAPERIVFCSHIDLNNITKFGKIIYQTEGTENKVSRHWSIIHLYR